MTSGNVSFRGNVTMENKFMKWWNATGIASNCELCCRNQASLEVYFTRDRVYFKIQKSDKSFLQHKILKIQNDVWGFKYSRNLMIEYLKVNAHW